MKSSTRLLATILFAATVLLPASSHAGSPFPCVNSGPTTITTIADTDGYQTSNDMNADGFTTLIAANFTVGAGPSCVVAQLSSHTIWSTAFGDEYVAYQVLIDGLPMYGHLSGCNTPQGSEWCVIAASNPDKNTFTDAHSYGFVLPNVSAGTHRILVRYAGCCKYDPINHAGGAYVGGTVITLHHE